MATSRPDSPDLTIVLLGHTGVGKSASGNSILGRAAFESKFSLNSLTTEVNMETATVFGKNILVCDTPGILGHEDMIKTWVKSVLQLSKQCLFLVVIRIGRFSAGQEKAVRATMAVLGEDGLKHSFLLFTHGDKLGTTSLDDCIFHSPGGSLPGFVQEFSQRTHLFDNVHGQENQVRELLEKSDQLQPYGQGSPLADFGLAVDAGERRIVLLGFRGAGTSSTGNTILGSQQFGSVCSFYPGNFQTVSRSARVEGRWLKVVDTPGFRSVGRFVRRWRLFPEIMESINEADPGPHAFIIVVPFDKITPRHFRMFELFGRDALKYAMVVFTHGDQISGRSMKSRIRADRNLRKMVTRCGGRYGVFDNTQMANRKQVRDLLEKIDQMVTDNNGKHCTSEMFRDSQGFP